MAGFLKAFSNVFFLLFGELRSQSLRTPDLEGMKIGGRTAVVVNFGRQHIFKLCYDHLFNFNSYMCKITNDICAVHSPVFATILKADK